MAENTFPKADSPSTSNSSSLRFLAGSLKKSRDKTVSGSGPRPRGLKTKEIAPASSNINIPEIRKMILWRRCHLVLRPYTTFRLASISFIFNWLIWAAK